MRPEIRELLRKATASFEAGSYDEAEQILLEVIQRTPLYANIYNMLGFIYSQQNSPEKAVEFFRKALTVNPNYTEARLNLVITLAEMGAYELASLEYGKAKQREEGGGFSLSQGVRNRLANAHADLGKVYHELGLYDEAVQEFQKALRFCPTFADILCRLGVSLREKGAYEEAATAFYRALEINPRYVDVYAHLGLTYLKQGMMESAIHALERALELDADHSLAKVYLRLAKQKGSE
ncbi:MAG: tetratricopeptide repeat protein [candidate division NC10 bacterium]|nr:tetratricopeptide repeat protein [candidate division NC10 bacterium]